MWCHAVTFFVKALKTPQEDYTQPSRMNVGSHSWLFAWECLWACGSLPFTHLQTHYRNTQNNDEMWHSQIYRTHYPSFLYFLSWFGRTEPGSHTPYPVRHWHTIMNTHARTDFITSSLLRFLGILAFMGAWKPHHSCGMSLPMCSVRHGREEALKDNITGKIPLLVSNAISVTTNKL